MKTQLRVWTAVHFLLLPSITKGFSNFVVPLGRAQQCIPRNRYGPTFSHSLDPERTFQPVSTNPEPGRGTVRPVPLWLGRSQAGIVIAAGKVGPRKFWRLATTNLSHRTAIA